MHFLYDWTNKSIWSALVSGVNESTWEHMKLLFFPMFIFAVIESRLFKERKNFWCVKLKGVLLGLMLIPVIFYTYNGVFGKSPDFINISIFFVAAAVSYIYETRILNRENECKHPKAGFLLLCSIGVLFIIFTFFTPKIPLFMDPVTGGYGLQSPA